MELLAWALVAVFYRVLEDCLFSCLLILCLAVYLASLVVLLLTYNLFFKVNNRTKEVNNYCRKLLM